MRCTPLPLKIIKRFEQIERRNKKDKFPNYRYSFDVNHQSIEFCDIFKNEFLPNGLKFSLVDLFTIS